MSGFNGVQKQKQPFLIKKTEKYTNNGNIKECTHDLCAFDTYSKFLRYF